MKKEEGDLSVTALYTSAAWTWGKLPGASLLTSDEASRVFRVVNAALAIARLFFAKLPSLAHSLVQRHVMIDRLLSDSRCQEVLELAAGLSRRGVTFSADPRVSYVEVDLPGVIEKKRALLGRSSEGRHALARPNFKLVAGDVSTIALADVTAPEKGELFVIAEGLLMYLQPAAQRALFESVAARLRSGGGTLVFDLVPPCEQPRPGRVGRALEWMMKRFTGGRSFVRDARTRTDIVGELVACGFSAVRVLEPHDVAEAWQLPFPNIPTQQVVFCSRFEIAGKEALK